MCYFFNFRYNGEIALLFQELNANFLIYATFSDLSNLEQLQVLSMIPTELQCMFSLTGVTNLIPFTDLVAIIMDGTITYNGRYSFFCAFQSV